jgi:rSAM/selenodomain-associated transferase 1
MQTHLLIMFVKYPTPGQVKSRLAAALGNREAALVYKFIAERLFCAVAPLSKAAGYAMAIAYAPADAGEDIRSWLGPGMQLMPQSGEDLGERMRNAFSEGFDRGYTKIIMFGSDCPAVTSDLINEALHKLDSHDAVIGPATDGGYYLIGLRRSAPELFTGIDWSTELVLRQTIERCNAAGLRYMLLPELRDIDRMEDLEFYRRQGMEV